MSVNCDSRTITPTTLAAEYALLERVFDWKKGHFLKCNLEAIRHAFCDEATKRKLEGADTGCLWGLIDDGKLMYT